MELKVALVGFGGIARFHNAAYYSLVQSGYPIKLVAICDSNAEQFKKKIAVNLGEADAPLPEDVKFYTNVDEMIEKEDFDMADICLPTFLHKPFAVKLLNAGKHVLCEKPMALNADEATEMIEAANYSGVKLLIAQCLRFDPYYLYLKDCVETARFGKMRHMTMERLSIYPTWGDFSDAKSGGAYIDTHIHDIDIAQYLFGKPKKVSSIIFNDAPHCQLIHSQLFYDGCTVLADCAWDETRPTDFECSFKARFEKAAVIFDGHTLKVFPDDGEVFEPEITGEDRVIGEIRHIADLILKSETKNINPPESSLESIKIIEYLKKSADLGGEPVII